MSRRRSKLWIPLLLLAPFAATPAAPAWLANGNPVGTGSGDQILPRAVPDGAGGAYVCWLSQNGGGYDAYAQHLTSTGAVAAGWPAGGLLLGTGSGGVELSPDGTGGVYACWYGTTVWLQRLTSAGSPVAGWPAGGVDAAGALGGTAVPKVILDGSGGALVSWAFFDGSGWSARGQRVDSSGAKQWGATGVQVTAAPNSTAPWLVTDGAGGFFAVLQSSPDALQWDITVQRITSAGAVSAGWPANGIVVAGASGGNHLLGAQGQIGTDRCAVSDGNGGVIVAWEESLGHDVFALRIQGDGSVAPGWTAGGTAVALFSQTGYWGLHAVPVTDGAGGVIVLWDEFRVGGTDVLAQRLSDAGALLWGPVDMLSAAANQAYPVAASNGAGGAFLVPGQDARNGSDSDAYAQLVDGFGSLGHPVTGLLVATAAGDQTAHCIAATGPGTAIVVFEDFRNGRDKDVYAAAFAGAGNVDVTITPAGWASPAVPRDVTGSTPTSAPLPAVLPGNAAGTWANWSFHNEPFGGLPEYAVTPPQMSVPLFLDGDQVGLALTPTSSWTASHALDTGPLTVRGGRHTLTSQADPQQLVAEWDETDNSWSGQWVWSPLATAFETPLQRVLPPRPGGFPLPNCDGFEFARNPTYAWIVSMAPSTSMDDYDLVAYDDYSGSTAGFSNAVGTSVYGGNATDFVVGHYSLTPNTVYAGVTRFLTGGGGNDFYLDQTDARFHQGGDAAAFEHVPLPAGRLADVYEAYLDVSKVYTFHLHRESGPSDLLPQLYSGTPGTVGGRGDAVATPAQVDADTWAIQGFSPAATGWHPLVVFRNVGTYGDQPMVYTLIWGDAGAVDAPELPAAGSRFAFDGARPNPAPGAAAFRFEIPAAGVARLALYDVTGRRVRMLLDRPATAGVTDLVWDGRDDRGARVAAGMYFARLEALGRRETRTVTVLR